MSAGMAAGGTGAVVRQGHLRKLKTMKKKFFVLRAETADSSARLEYYESEKKFKSGAAPRRALPLKSCYNITRRLDLKQKHVIALFTREEQFCVVAENEQDLHAWLSAILKQHRADDASEELLHPIQHVWQVNVQKRGLGAAKNIQGLYNLCLTDKTLTLVKIKSHNNVIRDLGIPDRVEYSLKNIRRCGDSECFFYMEVGRQTVTGSGELWMHSDDSNIAQSMHSTIYHAMRNCAKESENDRDHIVLPSRTSIDGAGVLPARRQTYSDGRGRAGLCNDATTFRNRCDSMPSRANCSLESERPPPHTELIEGLTMGLMGHDETDLAGEWHCTPRIPEEPDYCEMTPRDLVNTSVRSNSVQHSRTSSLAVEELSPEGASAPVAPDGYLPMAPAHDTLGGLVSASSGSVCSGTPSTDPRFSEYQLAPATSHIVDEEERPPRAYSVGSRPTTVRPDSSRHRAYSVGARNRPPPPPASASRHAHTRASSSAPLLPRASAEDLMELDFSSNSPAARIAVARTPPAASNFDEYVDMSPRVEAGYVEMRPGEGIPSAQTHDGYVEMSYSRRDRAPTRPIAINRPPGVVPAPPPPAAASPPESQNARECHTPLGSQTIFPLSLESPASHEEDAEDTTVALTTVRESEEYVSLSGGGALNYAALDLAPRTASAAPATRSYTQIDFARSEKLHAADN